MSPAERPRRVVTRAPARLDLGGGWTDVPPYCEREGGFVCNIAIDRYATATLTSPATPSAPITAASAPPATDQPLIDAVMRRGGASRVVVALANDFPVGSGLGGSSAASAALLGALDAWHARPWERRAIAEEGRRIEVEEMGIAGGRQDHYAATHGGALALGFSTVVTVKRLEIQPATRKAFERRSLLIHTGQSRISGDTIIAVRDAYLAGEPRVLAALGRMKALAAQIAAALENGAIDDVASLMGEHWTHQRTLHPAIPTALIDEIVARAMGAGAIGAKAMGASGGGCVLVIASEDGLAPVRAAIEPLGTPIPFRVDLDGLTRCD